ncbi:alpha/beta hydrolase [Leucobacter sp. NPDC077196]|uniref:alpha/beta hydrolase n=1 Tax=Leucobacter sp. NPDC077196 TaxID=3154959 RepID=UPI00342B8230
MVEISSNTVLQSRREEIELQTADGLTLYGELALPFDREPRATLVTLHPLPTAGGFMESHILRKAANRLPELADIAVLRFNTRGTSSPRGTSEGAFGDGVSEEHDVAAAMAFVADRALPIPWLLGWSFGTELALKYGLAHPIEGAILLSPPLHRATAEDVEAWQHAKPELVALIPEFDDYLRPGEAAERFASVPRMTLIPIEGGRHLWVGEKQTRRVLDEIVTAVGTAAAPLPTEVDEERLQR